MMYTYIMERTQIYLSDQEARVLQRLSNELGKSKSQLIRDAIDETYLGRRVSGTAALRAVRRAAGSWQGRRESGAQYVDRIRSGRLSRIRPARRG